MRYRLSECRAYGVKNGKKVNLQNVAIDSDNLEEVGLTRADFEELLTSGHLVNVDDSPPEAPPLNTLKARGKWRFDPAVLETKTLEQLNVMAKEIDPDIEPFEDLDEALAVMSTDFIYKA